MMKHIIYTHGDEECKRYLENKYTFGEKCLFKHKRIIAQNVTTNLQIPPQYTPLVMEGQEQNFFRMMNQMMSQMMNQLNLNQ